MHLVTGSDRYGDWMQTAGNRQFWPLDPRPEEIYIEDIAHSLAHQCRFAGHVNRFYSVADHSVLVSMLCDKKDALTGLLHDATEAYLVDVPTPVKRYLDGYKAYEDRLYAAVAERFGLPAVLPASVKHADAVALATEARDLMGPRPAEWRPMPEPHISKVIPLPPMQARLQFLKRFEQLGGVR